MLKYFLLWFPMVLIAVLNATIREYVYLKYVGELRAHQIATATGILLMGIYIWGVIAIWRPTSTGQAIGIGIMWLLMTVAFEFLFGHFVMKESWNKLCTEYNLFEGRVWLLFLIWLAVAPYLFYRLQKA